jgi:metal-responsive CopG/Arc/MetJ family transcriptional regulator
MSTTFQSINLESMAIPPAKPSALMHFTIDTELQDAVEDFRFKHRFNQRSSAIKWLLRWALEQNPTPDEAGKDNASRSPVKKPRKRKG